MPYPFNTNEIGSETGIEGDVDYASPSISDEKMTRIYAVIKLSNGEKKYFASKRNVLRQKAEWKRDFEKSFVYAIEFKLSKKGVLQLLNEQGKPHGN